MTTKTFASLKELQNWCNEHTHDQNLLVYWGWLENFSRWYSVADPISDASDDWFVMIDEEGNEVPRSVEIYIKEEGDE